MTTLAVATVLGGFWPTNGVNSMASISGEGSTRGNIRQMHGVKGQLANRAIMVALMGAAPGATATKNYTRIANSTELGGARAIETQVLVNRVTTAADVTEMVTDYLTMTTRTTFGANPPVNLDRNPLGTR
jgi:hypothetical protein